MTEILSAAGENKKQLAVVFTLTTVYMIVEVIGGLLTNSLALLADAGHMLTDAGALALALLAIWFAERPPTPGKTYGYYRVEILAALANAVVLLFISVYILWEAWLRWQEPPQGHELAYVGGGDRGFGRKLHRHATAGQGLGRKPEHQGCLLGGPE